MGMEATDGGTPPGVAAGPCGAAARTWRSLLAGQAAAQQQVAGQHQRRSRRLLGAVLRFRCNTPSAAGHRRAPAAASAVAPPSPFTLITSCGHLDNAWNACW